VNASFAFAVHILACQQASTVPYRPAPLQVWRRDLVASEEDDNNAHHSNEDEGDDDQL
jgi:hypothetical protein